MVKYKIIGGEKLEFSNKKYAHKWETMKNISFWINLVGLSFLLIDVFIEKEPLIVEIMPLTLFSVGVPLSFISDFYSKKYKK